MRLNDLQKYKIIGGNMTFRPFFYDFSMKIVFFRQKVWWNKKNALLLQPHSQKMLLQ
jgi:hypothetical protein